LSETKIKSNQAINKQFYWDANGSSSLTDNMTIVAGYDIVNGAAAAVIVGTVSFGVTFDSAPAIVITANGKNADESTTYPPADGESECFAYAYVPTTTGFSYTIRRNDAGNLTLNDKYFINYIAIGVIS